MLEKDYEREFAVAITTYLGLIVDRLSSFCTIFCRWKSGTEQNIPIFSGRQALPIVYDYFEVNVTGQVSTSWKNSLEVILGALTNIIKNATPAACTFQASATDLPFPDSYFDAIFTDPPYYDNVPYSYLSDFFYVWLKRALGDVHPKLFSTPLTPKSKEIVAYTTIEKSWNEAKQRFEGMLRQSFKEINRILKPNGIAVIVYAHKTTMGWEAVINALLDSGLVITASWPINTEMKARLRAKESASLASSIYIVARKTQRQPTGWFSEVKEELKKHLNEKLDKLWGEGIGGADFFIAAIGSAIEVFGKYEKVMDYEGNVIRAERLLDYVRQLVTDYAVRKILRDGIAGQLSPLSRFYLLYRWSYGTARVHFDEARKLAQSVGVDLERVWNRTFVRKEKEYIYVLGPHERDLSELEGSSELVDVLHRVLLLWQRGQREEIKEVLKGTGWFSDTFFRYAQAISECLPESSREKRLLDGFLTGRERIISEGRGEGSGLSEFLH